MSAKLAGTGQGNKFSGDSCRDASCLMITQIENLNLGFEFSSYFIQNIEQIVAILFVDDADLMTNGEQD